MNFLASALRPHGREHVNDPEKDGADGRTPMANRTTILEPAAMQQLDTFRHMVGIHSAKGSTENSHNHLHFDGRAAPNVGIYNRVCHRESRAKRGFKLATLFINGCLGLQVIVAAALTAMGAANSNHKGITVFGAINTVIAGILTYLKGSGLPNRIRYYENEWKRVREYIEQRERDFSRRDCGLDVNRVVGAIEAMYEQVKADIQSNTPDNYISVTDIRARASASAHPTPHVNVSSARSKFAEMELKYGHKVTDLLESLAHKEEERLKRIEGDIDSKARAAVQHGRAHFDEEVEGARQWGIDVQSKSAKIAEREIEQARSGMRDWQQDLQDKSARTVQREIEHTKSGLLQRGLSFAKELEQTKKDVEQRSEDVVRGLDAVRAEAVQRGREYEEDARTRTARIGETGQDVQREVERTRDAAQRAGESIQQAGDTLQRAGSSVARVEKAVDDEIQLHRGG